MHRHRGAVVGLVCLRGLDLLVLRRPLRSDSLDAVRLLGFLRQDALGEVQEDERHLTK